MSFSPAIRPLDGLQQMMLRWEEFHPLNAAHVVALGERVSVDEVRASLTAALEVLELPPVEFSPCRRQVRYLSSEDARIAPPVLETVACEDHGDETVREVLDEQLNRPFPERGVHWPFRFAHVSAERGPARLLVVYRHAVSDSRGASLVVRCWLRTLFGLSHTGVAVGRNAPTLEELFPGELGPHRRGWRLRQSVEELTESLTCRRAVPRHPVRMGIASGFHGARLSVARLKRVASESGGTVQDALFAATLEGLCLLWSDQPRRLFRNRLALYATVDLRKEAPVPLDDAFGQWLGSMTVRGAATPGVPFGERVADVSRQTRAAKGSRGYRTHAAQLATMARMWDGLPRWYNRASGPRLFPVTSLVSNVNLSEFLGPELAAGFVTDYHRFTGTGIITPMMAGLTTTGPHANLTSTRHTDVFTEDEHRLLMRHIEHRLEGRLPPVATKEAFHARDLAEFDPPLTGSRVFVPTV